MDEQEQKLIALLIAKVDSGEEKNLPFDVHNLKGLNYGWTNDGKPFIGNEIKRHLSEQTIKELMALFPPS